MHVVFKGNLLSPSPKGGRAGVLLSGRPSEFVFVQPTQPALMVDFPADLPTLVWPRCYRHAGPGISTCTKNVHWPRPEAVATQLSPLRWSRT